MARDVNARERVESILYGFGVGESGMIAREIYEQEISPLIEKLERLILIQEGLPMTGLQAAQWVREAQDLARGAKDTGYQPEPPTVPLFKHAGFEQGCYLCTCHRCKNQHEADKHAIACEDCAVKILRETYPDADYTEADLSHVEVSREGAEVWVLEDGRHVPVPEGWSNEIPGIKGFSARIISTDGVNLIKGEDE